MKRLTVFAITALAFTSTVFAQSGSLSTADKDFLIKDRQGAAYELDAAKLAVTKGSRNDVKSYAEKIVQDHETYNAELESSVRSRASHFRRSPTPPIRLALPG